MITSILIPLDQEPFKSFKIKDAHGKDITELQNLSRTNVFIGPNNSGKSRFLRELFKIEKMKFSIKNQSIFYGLLNQNFGINKEYLESMQNIFKESNSLIFSKIGIPKNSQLLRELDELIKKINTWEFNYKYFPVLRCLRPVDKLNQIINHAKGC